MSNVAKRLEVRLKYEDLRDCRSEADVRYLVGKKFEEQGATLGDLRGAVLYTFADHKNHETVYQLRPYADAHA
jgi:hypothetical protein